MSIIKAKEKSNKIHENTIGKIIYGFLLFAPLLMIVTTSCYAIFNKNAHESYYGSTINEKITKTPTTQADFIPNTEYKYTVTTNPISSTYYFDIDVSNVTLTQPTDVTDGNLINRIVLSYSVSLNRMEYRFYKTDNTSQIKTGNNAFNFTFILDHVNSMTTDTNLYQYFSYYTYNKYSYLDNNFDYGIYKTEQSQYFNWSKSTALYTGLRATCQSLGIENTFTPMLMAYWLLISIIYFIFDIGLIMVHLVHRKIHEFTESV